MGSWQGPGERKKHGVDFADAVAVLHDPRAVTIQDEHPTEERFVTIGRDALSRVLVCRVLLARGSYPDHLGPASRKD